MVFTFWKFVERLPKTDILGHFIFNFSPYRSDFQFFVKLHTFISIKIQMLFDILIFNIFTNKFGSHYVFFFRIEKFPIFISVLEYFKLRF